MADRVDGTGTYTTTLTALTEQQSYFLEVPGTASAKDLSVVSFEAVERMGEPYQITIQLTHPDNLVRADYLGKDAAFTLAPADGTAPRKFSGCITRFSKTKTPGYQHIQGIRHEQFNGRTGA